MITIKDVASRAGVSIATVSYVLNQKRRVSTEAVARVEAAVAALNYVPSGAARKLKSGRSSVIGFVADNIANRCPSHVVQGLAAAAASHGYSVLISDLHDDRATELRALDLLVKEQVEGVIYCGFGIVEEQLIRIHRFGTPVVVVDKPPRSKVLPSVLIDNARSTELALEHLHRMGHREMRFISGDPNNLNTVLRNGAFRKFCRQHRIALTDGHIVMGSYSIQHGYAGARRLMEDDSGFTAVFCGDDMVAFGAMAAFRSHGWRIPEDIAVVGFADDPLSSVVDPGLTTIHYPMAEMGRRAFELFLEIKGKSHRCVPHELLPTRLVVRRSTDPAEPMFAQFDLEPKPSDL